MPACPSEGSSVEEPKRIAEIWNDRTVNLGAGELYTVCMQRISKTLDGVLGLFDAWRAGSGSRVPLPRCHSTFAHRTSIIEHRNALSPCHPIATALLCSLVLNRSLEGTSSAWQGFRRFALSVGRVHYYRGRPCHELTPFPTMAFPNKASIPIPSPNTFPSVVRPVGLPCRVKDVDDLPVPDGSSKERLVAMRDPSWSLDLPACRWSTTSGWWC